LAGIDGPTIVCAQAGNVKSGAFDPLDEIVRSPTSAGMVHVDGAFGIWAAGVPSLRAHMQGHREADSWSTDAHKWLNVPYDSGLAFVRDAAAHHAAMSLRAAYYVVAADSQRDGFDWTPESSRRARGFAVLAALQSLGRSGFVSIGAIAPRAPDGCRAGGPARRHPEPGGAEPGPRPLRGGWRRP
jgi:glutamate/tyrosine decarboxylase-like PLP-dependent enzyme